MAVLLEAKSLSHYVYQQGAVRIDAESVERRQNGTVAALVSAYHENVLLHRDRCVLSSEAARQRFLRPINDHPTLKASGLSLHPSVLLAFDEHARTTLCGEDR